MKIHPLPIKPTITIHTTTINRHKSLRRLPHIFSKILELPFYSDADVSVHETSDSFKFVVEINEIDIDIAAHTVEICPGVIKVVVRARSRVTRGIGDDEELEVDLWRFRLPESTLPERATAVFSDGELVVVVPKGVLV